jgi:hypothetical protein
VSGKLRPGRGARGLHSSPLTWACCTEGRCNAIHILHLQQRLRAVILYTFDSSSGRLIAHSEVPTVTTSELHTYPRRLARTSNIRIDLRMNCVDSSVSSSKVHPHHHGKLTG